MTTEEQLKKVDSMMHALKAIKSQIKRCQKYRAKSLNASPSTHTPKQLQKISADVTWENMELEMRKIDIARCFKGSFMDVSTDTQEFRPSPFHHYKY